MAGTAGITCFSPEEQVQLEIAIYNIVQAIKKREPRLRGHLLISPYKIILTSEKEGRNKTELKIRIEYDVAEFGSQPEKKITPLANILLPQRVKLEAVFEYLFWRINQLLLTIMPLTSEDSELVMLDFWKGNPLEFCIFTIYRNYPRELLIQENTIDVMLINPPGVKFKAISFSYSREKGWLICENNNLTTDKILSDCWEQVVKEYPDGHPNHK